MRINVAGLLKSPVGSKRDYDVSGKIGIAGGESNVSGQAALVRIDEGILVNAALDVDMELVCSRCLAPFRYMIKVNFDEEYFPTTDVSLGAPIPPPDEPGSFTIDEQHILDLSEAARQYALLSVPMKPLCCRDCAGICPTCGHNLNEGPCGCSPQGADPRWDKLRDMTSAENEDI